MCEESLGSSTSLADIQVQHVLTEINVYVWEYYFSQHKMVSVLQPCSLYETEKIIENAPESLITLGYIHKNCEEQLNNMFARLNSEHKAVCEVLCIKNKAGRYDWKKFSCAIVSCCEDKPLKAIIVAEDIPEYKEPEQRYLQEKNLYHTLGDDLLACVQIDLASDEAVVQKALQERKNIEAHRYTSLVEESALAIVEMPARRRYLELFLPDALKASFIKGQTVIWQDCRFRLQNGSIAWVRAAVSLYEDACTKQIKGFAYLRNVDETKKRELSLENCAERDAVTTLYKRSTMAGMVNSILKKGTQKKCAILVLHLDSFKKLPLQIGTDYANRLLINLAQLLRLNFAATAILGRTSTDEITVFLPEIESNQWVQSKAEALCALVETPDLLIEESVKISASIGVAFSECITAEKFEKLYLNGCKAMAQARKQGKNCVRMWGSPANENTVAPISDLNNGNLLEENQLLISCMASLLSIQSFETAMEIVLGHIGRYYGAQHV
ncbi:MAG: GGDEF domain-containing protein, partial [Oscillospiraceae bacterium]|nr:GGDEF domain-containing protein [Oscillospiraceae bacterium]